ncbi:LysM peptidoglycan-binding domain-containing protein [uncultured Campylobacter sp.]|uniref:LysM peptidoglycan-binding domain-containing protein n=1 Tax=uncultured Campylobacter sp. TaxID=218934 RepID=UPI002604541D|nr:LysM peptidoglycan-binding domain-containing protein [uncultured Campylobacter sp.]
MNFAKNGATFIAKVGFVTGLVADLTINISKNKDGSIVYTIASTTTKDTIKYYASYWATTTLAPAIVAGATLLLGTGVMATGLAVVGTTSLFIVVSYGTDYLLNNLEEIINQFIDHYTNKEIELYTPTIYGKITKEEFILKEVESSNGNFCKKVFPEYARYIQTRDLSKVDISTVSNSDFIQRITLEKNKNALAIKTASEVGSVKQATEIFEVINAMPNIPTVTLNSHTYDIRNLSNLEIRNAIDKIPQVSFLLSNILIRTGEELDLGSKGIYKVKSGDTLSTIAQRNGMVTKELLKLNTWLADEGRVKFLKNKVLVESNILELNEIDHVLVGDRNAENILIDANKGDNTLVGGNKKIS